MFFDTRTSFVSHIFISVHICPQTGKQQPHKTSNGLLGLLGAIRGRQKGRQRLLSQAARRASTCHVGSPMIDIVESLRNEPGLCQIQIVFIKAASIS